MIRVVIPPLFAVAAGVSGLVDDLRSLVLATGALYAVEHLAFVWSASGHGGAERSSLRVPPKFVLSDAVGLSGGSRRFLLAAGAAGLWALLGLLPGDPGSTPAWFMTPLLGGVTGLAGAAAARSGHPSWWRSVWLAWTVAAWAVPMSMLSADWGTLCLSSAGFALLSFQTAQRFLNRDGVLLSADGSVFGVRRRAAVGTLHAAPWAALAVSTVFASPPSVGRAVPADTVFCLGTVLAVAVFFSSIIEPFGFDGSGTATPSGRNVAPAVTSLRH